MVVIANISSSGGGCTKKESLEENVLALSLQQQWWKTHETRAVGRVYSGTVAAAAAVAEDSRKTSPCKSRLWHCRCSFAGVNGGGGGS